jgi:hypothetical protein
VPHGVTGLSPSPGHDEESSSKIGNVAGADDWYQISSSSESRSGAAESVVAEEIEGPAIGAELSEDFVTFAGAGAAAAARRGVPSEAKVKGESSGTLNDDE